MDNPIFKWNVFFLRMTAIYKPIDSWSWIQKMGYYVWRVVWVLCLYGGIVFNALDIMWRGNIDKISDIAINIMNLELYISITIRASYFAKDNTDIDYLAENLAKHFRLESRFGIKRKTLNWSRKAAQYLLIGWQIFVTVASTLMVLGCLVKFPRTLPIQIWTWYDWTKTEFYFLTLFVEWVSLTLTLLSFGNLDMLNATFMLLTSGEVEILASDFDNIFLDALIKQGTDEDEAVQYLRYVDDERAESTTARLDNIINTPEFKRDLMNNFTFCIEEHQKLLKFIDDYQDYISPYLLVEINFIFGYMIFMLFIFVITDNKSLYFALAQYVSGATGQIFVATYLGERLITAIEDMRDILYSVPWYLCDSHFLKNFKFVQLRMSKPVTITAGKLITMTLDTFLEFMKKAFSFFTVLRQYNNQQK